GNELLKGVGVSRRKQPVVGAPHEQRRYLDPVQPFVQMGIVVTGLPSEPCGRRAILERGVIQLRTLRARGHRLAEVAIVEHRADALLLAAQECIELFYAIDIDASGAEEGKGGEWGVISHCKVRGDPPAKRAADETDTVQFVLVEKREI